MQYFRFLNITQLTIITIIIVRHRRLQDTRQLEEIAIIVH